LTCTAAHGSALRLLYSAALHHYNKQSKSVSTASGLHSERVILTFGFFAYFFSTLGISLFFFSLTRPDNQKDIRTPINNSSEISVSPNNTFLLSAEVSQRKNLHL
jgi:hypothetical protein